MQNIIRRRFVVTGQVQGVGFRPFVYRLALEGGLSGSVRNAPEGVVIEVQGAAEKVATFGRDLANKTPPLARIVSLDSREATPVSGESAFRIKISESGTGHNVLISPDVATCPDCLDDMADPANRRFQYPFTNCTNCGPRYTITRSIPYDRATTSMACFPLCPACREEYENPLDRRFHAQPNACPVCGPKVWLASPEGETLIENDAAIHAVAQALAQERIAAIKGLGGYHLACDATSDAAVESLRTRKRRPSKPLAVMVPDLETLSRIAEANEAEKALLSGDRRPIVLLRAREGGPLSRHVSPDTPEVGLMLPYAPLHHVLFRHLREAMGPDRLPALVMTSGNLSAEPIALGNREALARLSQIADVFLPHNRDILIRTDDSVTRIIEGNTQFLRRARGYAPSPVHLASDGPSVVGLGPLLKCTLCVTKGDQAFLSQHIGDLENLETYDFYQEILEHLISVLRVEPEAVVADLHPDYMSSRFALEQEKWPVYRLQHHYAHIYAALAENRHEGPALGLALDGTGYGEDGTLWGGECLFVDPATQTHKRLGHFSPMALPGGEAAILNPWRIAKSCLYALGMDHPGSRIQPWETDHGQASSLVGQLLEKNLNCPQTTSCGRLFDAVSALLGLRLSIEYEGQAAILLENVQDRLERGAYACELDATGDAMLIDTLGLFRQAAEDVKRGVAAGVVSRRFHAGLIRGLTALALEGASREGVSVVALSGGVMQNRTLAAELPLALEAVGLTPLSHRLVPPNDACISLGQASFGKHIRGK